MVWRLCVIVAVNSRSPRGSPGGVPVWYVKGCGWLSRVYQDWVSVDVRWSLRYVGSVVMMFPSSLVVVVASCVLLYGGCFEGKGPFHCVKCVCYVK
eukprot:7057792-Alexandrium_andersonii.AAC.1